jgi:hypothetical protein
LNGKIDLETTFGSITEAKLAGLKKMTDEIRTGLAAVKEEILAIEGRGSIYE